MMSKHWAPDLDQFFWQGETPDARRRALESFVQLAREGEPIPPQMLNFIADGIERYLSGRDLWPKPKGRPTTRQTDWQTWAAWFAIRCDPQFANYPLSTVEGNRYKAAIDKLRLPITTARQMQNLVGQFTEGTVPFFIVTDAYWQEYARRMNWAENEATRELMMSWLPKRN